MRPLAKALAGSFTQKVLCGLVSAQVFMDDVAEAVIAPEAIHLRKMRALGVHVSEKHTETAKHVFHRFDSLREDVCHDVSPVVVVG